MAQARFDIWEFLAVQVPICHDVGWTEGDDGERCDAVMWRAVSQIHRFNRLMTVWKTHSTLLTPCALA